MIRKILVSILVIIAGGISFSQNAVNYFPAQIGYKWHYKVTPLDSLQQSVDSLSYIRIDSLADSTQYENKAAKVILSKIGTRDIVLGMPFIDTTYLSMETTNFYSYMSTIPGIDTLGIGGFLSGVAGWYNIYKLASAVNTSYTIFTKDSTITYNSTDFIVTFEVKAKRVADQTITTAIGTFNCKKFVLTPAVKAKLASLPIFSYTLVSMNDTVYIAPDNFVVRDNRPSANVDLSLLALPSFYIPGSNTEILSHPAILNASPMVINVSPEAGDSVFNITNSGSGDLNWNASVISGNEWLVLTTDSTGLNNAAVRFHFQKNNLLTPRAATVRVWSETAFGGDALIVINQDRTTGINQEDKIPDTYSLYDNYPNPFNPSTRIKYALPESGLVSLKIYDITGKEITTLVNENKQAGSYDVQFDASALSSGVYFYKLTANGFSQIKKMILMK